MFNVLIVGGGQLGSRYLQGLAFLDIPLAITLVDPFEASLVTARDRYLSLKPASSHVVSYFTTLEKVPKDFDLAIVATPAHCRSKVIAEISTHHRVQAWILEKLLAQSCEQLDHINQSLVGNCQVWVNTPRRLMAWHRSIRSQLLADVKDPLRVCVSGGSWGLACNAIHFIDLVVWWTQASVQSVNTEVLGEWVRSKRAGFQDVFGTMRMTYSDGSELQLSCLSGTEPVQITVATSQGQWIIDESAGLVTGPVNQQLQGQLSFQSALTAPLVKQILQEERCDLPTLAESTAQHRPLLTALLKHWNQNKGCQDSIVPIT